MNAVLRMIGRGTFTQERDRLRDAIAAERRAAKHLEEAQAASERAQHVLAESQRHEATAKDAEKAAATATTVAMLGEADDSAILLKHAAESDRLAADARIRAAGARAAMPDLLQRHEDAMSESSMSREAVRAARSDLLAAMVEPDLLEVERQMSLIRPHLLRVSAFLELSRSRWGPSHPFRGFSTSRRQGILERLNAATASARQVLFTVNASASSQCDEMLADDTNTLLDIGKRLMTNPDA